MSDTSTRHQLILASAGTGKTWQLSNRFLALLLAGVEPASILATTFTRKAASEILDRVLERLVEAIENPTRLDELNEALGRSDIGAGDCLELLAGLTRHLDSLRVRTIDSFFLHLVRLFALDLELPPDWRIVTPREASELRGEAIQELLGESRPEQVLELLRALHQGGAWRRVQAGLLDVVFNWRPILLESTPGAWEALDPGPAVPETELREALDALATAPVPQTAKGDPNKTWLKARDAVGTAVAEERWAEIFAGGLGKAYLAGDCPDTRVFSRKPFPEELDTALGPVIAHARHHFLTGLCERNQATHALLESFEAAYTAHQRRRGAYRFEDLPLALAPRTASELPIDARELDLWYRLDGRIDHLLLDEFQDTSPIQWRILAPIASEIAADGTGERSFFCVGDVKQSIYAFRQAEPRLLAEMPRILPGLEPEMMRRSYRSSSVVLEAVNRVFEGMTENDAFEGDGLEPYREAATRWKVGFPEHLSARPELTGSALVLEAREPRDDEPAAAPLLELCLERVERIRDEVPHASIAVLMRENKNIPLLIHRLRQRGIDASGEGGGALTDSEAVLAYLSILHLADHPEDSAAAFHVASSRFGASVGLDVDADATKRRELARDLRAKLVHQGLGAVTRDLAATVTIESGWSAWDVARFAQLLDLAYAFEGEAGLRPSLFVHHVRGERVEAPGGARVRVMTIHASKGLEFDAVVLPELTKPFVSRSVPPLVDRPRPESRIELVTHSPTKKLLGIDETLARLYAATTTRTVEDSLSGLYVALTRAARKIEVLLPWVDPDQKKSKAPTLAQFVRAALPPAECGEPDEERVIWRLPENATDASWGEGIAEPEATAEEIEATALGLAPSTGPRSLPRRSPSAGDFGRGVSAASLLGGKRGARRGTLVHRWLEELTWIEDFELDEARLLELSEARRVEPRVRETALELLRAAVEEPEIREALSRANCGAPADSEPEVRNEYAFSIVLTGGAGEEGTAGPEELWNGSIDRLVLARRGGEVVYAEILDYKTDLVGPADDLLEKAEHYREQLEGYRRVVVAQTGLAPETIPMRLLFLEPGRVVKL